MKIQLVTDKDTLNEAKVVALPVFEGEPIETTYQLVKDYLSENKKFGSLYETQFLFDPVKSFLLVGAGKREKLNFQICQNLAGTVSKYLISKCKEVVFMPPQLENLSADKIIYALGVGAELAAHDPSRRYKSETEPILLLTFQIYLEKAGGEEKSAIRKATVVAEAMNTARLLGDMPASEMTPTYFITESKKIAKENKLKITIINEAQAKKMGMAGFTSVAKGSDEPSFVVVLEYLGDKRSKEKWGLIGKGITFDSGGISIKKDDGMHEMKYDMSGAGTVLATMLAIANLEPKINVVGVCMVTENLPSGKAFKPGDIIKLYCGKTTEVLSTDAEGRMILADGLTLAQKDFKATKLIDLATLTGAVIIALGDFITGVFSNNLDLEKKIIEKGNNVGEKFWAMPMDEEYDELLKSEIADINNVGIGGSMRSSAGSIAGAKFLEKVIENNIPWVHLDIAGTAWDNKPKPYRGAGATGVGIKTLVELLIQ